MISVSSFLDIEATTTPRRSREADGLERLSSDLEEMLSPTEKAPEALKRRLLDRIAAEPARVETDAHGCIIAVNPAFSHLCGYSFSEVRGRKPGALLQGPDSDPEAVTELRAAVKAGSACDVEIINYHKDGSPYRVRVMISPVHDEREKLTGFRAVEIKLPL